MINIVFFAKYRESSGVTRDTCTASDVVDVDALRQWLWSRHGDRMRGVLDDPRCLVSRNQQLITANVPLSDGDEVAFFPPVTGG